MRRSEAAARQENKDSRLTPLTRPPRRASRLGRDLLPTSAAGIFDEDGTAPLFQYRAICIGRHVEVNVRRRGVRPVKRSNKPPIPCNHHEPLKALIDGEVVQ